MPPGGSDRKSSGRPTAGRCRDFPVSTPTGSGEFAISLSPIRRAPSRSGGEGRCKRGVQRTCAALGDISMSSTKKGEPGRCRSNLPRHFRSPFLHGVLPFASVSDLTPVTHPPCVHGRSSGSVVRVWPRSTGGPARVERDSSGGRPDSGSLGARDRRATSAARRRSRRSRVERTSASETGWRSGVSVSILSSTLREKERAPRRGLRRGLVDGSRMTAGPGPARLGPGRVTPGLGADTRGSARTGTGGACAASSGPGRAAVPPGGRSSCFALYPRAA